MIKIPEPPYLSLYISDNLVKSVGYIYKSKDFYLKSEVEKWCVDTLSGKWKLYNSKVNLGLSFEKKIPLDIQLWEIKFEKISDLIVFKLKWL